MTRTDQNGACNLRNRSRLDTLPTVFGPDNASAPDVLVNNAGGFSATRRVTADSLEHTFAVNHLAPFLLTGLLLDRLTACRPGPDRDRVLRRPHDRKD